MKKGGVKKLQTLYVGDISKAEKVQMFHTLVNMIEEGVNKRLKSTEKNYQIVFSKKVQVTSLGNEWLSQYSLIVCSRGAYLRGKKHFDIATGRTVVVFANEKSDEIAKEIVIVSIKNGKISPIEGDMFFLLDA